jgi:hypothetical protein
MRAPRSILAASLLAAALSANAGGAALGALSGMGDALSDIASRDAEQQRQMELIQRQHDLEMQRMQREFELQRRLAAPPPPAPRPPAVDREIALVDRVHPGWRTLVATDEFGAWLQAQPPETRRLARSNSGADAVQLIDQYKARRAPPK